MEAFLQDYFTFAVRFKMSRYAPPRFDTILLFHRFEAAVESACKSFHSLINGWSSLH
jgi:hypothetical protein